MATLIGLFRDLPCRIKNTLIVAAIGCLAIGCLLLGWKIGKPTRPGRLDPPAAAVVQTDGSVIVERKPNPEAKPPHEIPKGAKVERVVQVKVRPRAAATVPTSGDGLQGKASLPSASPETTVDLSLVRMPDQTRRVIASSPDGEIVGGLDVPVEAAPTAKASKNTLITGWSPPFSNDFVLGYTRKIFTLGPISVEAGGMAVYQDRKLKPYLLGIVRW